MINRLITSMKRGGSDLPERIGKRWQTVMVKGYPGLDARKEKEHLVFYVITLDSKPGIPDNSILRNFHHYCVTVLFLKQKRESRYNSFL